MVDPLSGVSAVIPVNAGKAIDSSLAVIAQNLSLGPELAKQIATEASSLELSQTGQLIESVMGLNLPQVELSSELQPLLASPPMSGQASTPELAQSLDRALSNSGLFYESHLAEWVSGTRSQAQIMQEPQAKLTQPVALNPRSAIQEQQSAEVAQRGDSLLHNVLSSIHPQSVATLQHQLQSIDNQIIPWQGQIWPGQNLEWTVQPDVSPDEEHQQYESSSPIRWKSVLKLTLPNIGEVQAELTLGPQGCQVNLITEPQQCAKVQKALPDLGLRLQEAGIRPERLKAMPKETGLEASS